MNRRHFIKSAAVLALAGPMLPKAVAAPVIAVVAKPRYTVKWRKYKHCIDCASGRLETDDICDVFDILERLESLKYNQIDTFINGRHIQTLKLESDYI